MLWVGVDIGGTFTDVIVYDTEARLLRAAKSLSTPAEPVRAVLEALHKLDVDLSRVTRFVHGTTRVTNALLEGTGGGVALLTTEGFRDVVAMGRGHRHRLYSVKEVAPPRLVERRLCFEVPERMRADGTVHRALDLEAVQRAIEKMKGLELTGVAVCFLNAYSNPAHEEQVAALVRERLPEVACSSSAEVVPEIGEYERFTTTVLNVAVKPFVSQYLASFLGALREHGYGGGLSIMTSSGGVVAADDARRLPMQLALSGPAGGVSASAYVSLASPYRQIITCDMGGTSTDVCVIREGLPSMTNLGEIAGYPNKTFQIEIKTIGAGGGSIAWIDIGGELSIGPQSAGSMPGPASYGRGGTEATTTDAHLVIGHLDPEEPLGGEVKPDLEAARAAMERLSGPLGGLPVERIALGIVQVAVAKMTSAIKEITYARGLDPRDFVLLPFGGAGPMHATALADELGIDTVVVPPVPGNLSALGFITARARLDLVRTMLLPVEEAALPAMAAAVEGLCQVGIDRLVAGGLQNPADVTVERSLGMRIRGQSFDLHVPIAAVPRSATELAERFREAYQARYAYLPATAALEVVSVRVIAFGPQAEVNLAGQVAESASPPRSRRIYSAEGWADAMVYRRSALRLGAPVAGPAIFRESGATTVMGRAWRAEVDTGGNLVLRRT
jgi:N-methylhydantoinase A